MDDSIRVPLLDLKAQFTDYREEAYEAIQRVVETQYFVNGPEVQGLEEAIAEYCGVRSCIGVSSGTDALLASLMALEIGPGDEVITTPYTFFATAGSIHRAGARPVFVDIDPETYNIDPGQIEERITPRTKAILPVHLYGQCAEMDPILGIARRHGLPVIEDAAQAIGAESWGRRAGSMGTVGCFSFFPSKNLGGFGDGGAIVTNDEALADRIRLLRNHGAEQRYYHRMVGGNFRLDAIQAAVLRVKLKYLDAWTAGRQANAKFYTRQFERRLSGTVRTPIVRQDRHIYNQYVIAVPDRDRVRAFLKEHDVASEIYYPEPLHRQECFGYLAYEAEAFPVAERAAATTLALPIYAELTEEQQTKVVDAIEAALEHVGVKPAQAA